MKTKYLAIAALALGMVACEQATNNVEIPADNCMLFDVASLAAHTRVSNGVFVAEDKVGVYVTDYADATTPAPLQISGNRANNEGLIFDGTTWATERPVYWGGGKSDVYAYYPYMAIEDVDEQPFAVATDQTVEGAYENSDFLWAKAEGVAQTDGAVSLQMQHSMSRLVVKIMAGEEYIGSLPADATVHLHSTVTDARVSLANGSIVKDPYGGTHSIKMRNLGIRTFAEGEAVVYEAIVVPQMLETSVPLLEINSKSVSYLLEDMFNFKPGVSYTYTAVLNTSTNAIKVEIGCEVEDWNNIGGGSEGDDSGNEGGEDDGIDLSTYTDLSAEGTANCYLVKAAGNYKFKAVKGNSNDTVGNVKSVEVLWETFGTDVMPNVGDIIKEVGYKNGYVYFSTPEVFGNGNASIAVRNSKDVILWSWHIWCSEEGWNDHIYPNNAGTMMDRNLGATSATPGDVGTFGLLYQWGRKDPFMGPISENNATLVATTGNWPTWTYDYYQMSLNYAEENPTTFIWRSLSAWHYGDNVASPLWDTNKTIYDPCPAGYRVPGDTYDFFERTYSNYEGYNSYDSILGYKVLLADGETYAWYPQSGYRNDQTSCYTGCGCYWTVIDYDELVHHSYQLKVTSGSVNFNSVVISHGGHQNGCSVRCVKE